MRRGITALLLGLGLTACGDDSSTGSGGATSDTDASSGSETTGGATTASAGGGASTGTTTSAQGSVASTTTGAGGESSSSSGGGGGQGVGCLEDLSAGHHQVECEGGITYEVEIPPACLGELAGFCGLVVDMHGYTMNAGAEDENTGVRALGVARGYVVVQPTAPADGFGLPSWDQPSHAPLVHRFLADLADGLPLDRARFHAMGFSQGGGMTFRLLCDHADFFASGAPIGAIAGCEFSGDDMPGEEVDILQVHGRLDAVVNFGGVAVPQRDAALAAWDFGAPDVYLEDDRHRATRWVTSNGTTFEFWEHDYVTSATAFFLDIMGHCVPGGDDLGGNPAGFSCEDTNTFVFGELAMDFFSAHTKD